jgi:hypothetical protein
MAMSDFYYATKRWHRCRYCMGLFNQWFRHHKGAEFNEWAARMHFGEEAVAFNLFVGHRCAYDDSSG